MRFSTWYFHLNSFSTIFEDELEAHIQRCNTAKQQVDHLPFFSKGYNIATQREKSTQAISNELGTDADISQFLTTIELILRTLLLFQGNTDTPLCPSEFLHSTEFDGIIKSIPESEFITSCLIEPFILIPISFYPYYYIDDSDLFNKKNTTINKVPLLNISSISDFFLSIDISNSHLYLRQVLN